MDAYALSALDEFEAESIHILRESAAEFERPVLVYANDAASCVLLRLAQKAFSPAGIPFPVLDVEGPETHRGLRGFRERICSEAKVELRDRKGRDVRDAIAEDAYDAVIDSVRRDEARSRARQNVFSRRDAHGRLRPEGEQPELWNLYCTRLKRGESMRVRPLSNWTGLDIRHYLAREGVEVPLEHSAVEGSSNSTGGVLRFVLAGAAGSGKSALAAQLLGEVRGEGETTVGAEYRQFYTAGRRFILIDAPGTEHSTRDMAAAASHADLAVLLVDARHGIVAQTRRHAFICSLLGIPRLAVVVNKMDLVDYAVSSFTAVREEFEAFAARLGFKSLVFIPVSAQSGANVAMHGAAMRWYGGQTLREYLEGVYVGGDRNLVDFRLSVQSAVAGDGISWFCGQIGSGVVKVGDEIAVVPSHRRSRVRSIMLHDQKPERAFAPLCVSIELDDKIDVSRGAVLAHPANMPRAVRSVDAMVLWMNDLPLRAGETYFLRQGGGWVRSSCAAITFRVNPDSLHREDAQELVVNDIGRAMFTLFEERFVDAYPRNRNTGCFLVVDPESSSTLGAGMIVDREIEHGRVRRTAERVVVPHIGKVSDTARSVLLRQHARTIWLTGLSGSGKSTLATELERELVELGHACFMLDGDNVRAGLNRDLGFGPDDRSENIRRIAEVARLMNDAGLIAITAFISPYREDREMARAIVGAERFVEVYLDASLEACERRDPKGLYRKARAGQIPEFTGVSAPYEFPEAPSLTLDTARRSVEECTARLLAEVLSRIR